MVKPLSAQHIVHASKVSPASGGHHSTLNYQDAYLCPVCRHGHISALTLMDAFACNFCRHIFTANLQAQSVQVVDSSQPMSWRWTGRKWQASNRDDLDLTVAVWLIGMALVVLPSAIVFVFAYLFPPLPDSQLSWFPAIWCATTLIVHLGMVTWLVAEHYQIPFYVANKIRLQRWLHH